MKQICCSAQEILVFTRTKEIHKKIWKKYCKKQCYRATTKITAAQGRKWAGSADVLWYSQFQQWKLDEFVICLRGTIPKPVEWMMEFEGP